MVEVDGVEAGGPGGYGLEQGAPEPVPRLQTGELEEVEIDGRQGQEQAAGHQNHLGLHPVAPELQTVGFQVVPGHKADAAGDNQHHDHQIYRRMGREGGERGVGCIDAHQVEARVAEGGYGVEEAVPEALKEAEPLAEHRGQGGGSQQLQGGGGGDNKACQPDNAPQLRSGDGLLHDAPLPERNPLARGGG